MKYPLTILAMTMMSSAVLAQSTPTEVAVLQTLKQKYSNTTFKSISATQIPGVYEVIMGKNVAYVDETGRYFLFGRLFDMQTQTDLTEPKLEKSAQQQPQINWEKLDLKNAIVTVRGNGNRKVWVAPYEDDANDLHDQSYFYTMVHPGEWMIESNRSHLRNQFRPVLGPTGGAQARDTEAAASERVSQDESGIRKR